MPGKDGTGPARQGLMVGRGLGWRGQYGTMGAGSARYCVCPKCGEKITHLAGTPCTSIKCLSAERL